MREQTSLDRAMLELDGTEKQGAPGSQRHFERLPGCRRTAALAAGLPLYQYLGGVGRSRMPLPMMNILNGGAHAANNLEVQEFMVVPVGAETFAQALHLCSRIFHTLKATLAELGTPAQGVGDEGGYAPNLPSDEAAIEAILKAGEQAGYRPGRISASRWTVLLRSGQGEGYVLPNPAKPCPEMRCWSAAELGQPLPHLFHRGRGRGRGLDRLADLDPAAGQSDAAGGG